MSSGADDLVRIEAVIFTARHDFRMEALLGMATQSAPRLEAGRRYRADMVDWHWLISEIVDD